MKTMAIIGVLSALLLLPGCATITAGAIGGAIVLGLAGGLGTTIGSHAGDNAYDRWKCRRLKTWRDREDCYLKRQALR